MPPFTGNSRSTAFTSLATSDPAECETADAFESGHDAELARTYEASAHEHQARRFFQMLSSTSWPFTVTTIRGFCAPVAVR